MISQLFGIVKVPIAKVRNQKVPDDKFIVDTYALGEMVELDYCDKLNWCKIKDKQLFISKVVLAVKRFKNNPMVEEKIIAVELKPKKEDKKEFIKDINIPFKIKKKVQIKKCNRLKQIDIKKDNLFSSIEQKKLSQKYLTKCIDGKLLKSLLADISNFYSQKGYITTKPYLKPQNIKDGQLDIDIAKGMIEDIIHSETNTTSGKITTAFIGQKGKVLNLREIETSLEMINRVSSSKAIFQIRPSKKKGASILVIKTEQTTPLHLTLGVSGSRSLKDNNPYLTANLALDNLLNINDIFTFTLNGSRIQEEYQSSKGKEFNYSFSVGSYLLEFIKSYSTYRQGVDGINDIYLSDGDTIGTKVKISKIVSRDQKNKYKLAFMVYHKGTKNYFENELIETSSYKTTLAQINLIHTFIQKWGQVNTTYSIYQGKDWFGARGDDYNGGETNYKKDEKLEFNKYTLSSNLVYYLPNKTYQINSNFHLQYANDNLYSSDKISIGSSSSVRGYSSNYFGNTAWYIKNDLVKDISLNLYEPLFQNLSLYIGLDYGKVPCRSDNTQSCGEMYGSGTGFRTNGKNFSTNFSWNRALKKLSDDFQIKNQFTYNFTIKF